MDHSEPNPAAEPDPPFEPGVSAPNRGAQEARPRSADRGGGGEPPPLRRAYPAAPLRTTLQQTEDSLRSLSVTGIRTGGYDLDEYRMDIAAAKRDEESAGPRDAGPTDQAAEVDGGVFVARSSHAPRLAQAPWEVEPEAAAPTWLARAARLLVEDRRVQLLVLGIAVAIGVIPLFVHESKFVPISRIRKHAGEFDGQVVSIKGRVGEVFALGGSYIYYLHQGRDTIVVFSRARTPIPSEHVTVTGSVSTGYLEGVPRLALFETAQ